ncbi:MAG: cellulase family glycosylhydrolase [Bacillota bacterium]|nr:cellulase family glycosylhydrolase [Bacillota bacterium]
MEKFKKRILTSLMSFVMVFICAANGFSLSAYADLTGGVSTYTTKGEKTLIILQAFAQNTTNDWTFMNIGDTAYLPYQQTENFSGIATADATSTVNSSANFGLFISDTKLADGDRSNLKFHVGTVTIKATGYDDLVVNLNKDYNETYLASKVSWGMTGNSTSVLLNNYLPTDKATYIKNITSVKADVTLSGYQYLQAKPAGQEFPPGYTHPTTMRNISSMDLVKDIKIGWNLGNTLDSWPSPRPAGAAGADYETTWGNPKTTIDMISAIKQDGFNAVRIPITWDTHYIDSNDTIDPAFMQRVDTVVNYVLCNNMYAIINIHHNASQKEVDAADEPNVLKEYDETWTQISNHFKDYGDKLIFETQNEPIYGENWNPTNSASDLQMYKIVNETNAKALSAIRATGGNNTNRLVMMPTYAASSTSYNIQNMVVPSNDAHVAVSIHAYIPYNFALNDQAPTANTFGDQEKQFISSTFASLNDTFVKKGIPVIIGEFGAINKDNVQARADFAKYFTQTAATYGIPSFWWDNNSFVLNQLGLFNRASLEIEYPTILQGMIDGWNAGQPTKPTVAGDVNGDGKVNVLDYLKFIKYLANTSIKINTTAADLNGDGIVDSKDKPLLLKKLLTRN